MLLNQFGGLPVYFTIIFLLSITLDYLYHAFLLGQSDTKFLQFDNGEFVPIQKSLGAGYNGVAFKTKEEPPNVIKVVVLPNYLSVAIRRWTKSEPPGTEVEALKFVGDFRGEYFWKGRLVMKMKFHEGMTLKRCILNRIVQDEDELDLFSEMAWNEVIKLRERGIAHGDVNMNNMLYDIQDEHQTNETRSTVNHENTSHPINTRIDRENGTDTQHGRLLALTRTGESQETLLEKIRNTTKTNVYRIFPNRAITVHLIDFGFATKLKDLSEQEWSRKISFDNVKYDRMRRRSRKLLIKVQNSKSNDISEEEDDDDSK